MRASNAPFNEFGWAELIRTVEDLTLKVNAGTNDLNDGDLAVDQVTADQLTSALAGHEAESNPHPQYLLESAYTQFTATACTMRGGGVTSATESNRTTIINYALESTTQSLSGLNVTTGVFTAPAAGIYLISGSASIYLQAQNGFGINVDSLYTDLRLVVNGVADFTYSDVTASTLIAMNSYYPHAVSKACYMASGHTAHLDFIGASGSGTTAVGAFGATLSVVRVA